MQSGLSETGLPERYGMWDGSATFLLGIVWNQDRLGIGDMAALVLRMVGCRSFFLNTWDRWLQTPSHLGLRRAAKSVA